jgi:hypothetical protein
VSRREYIGCGVFSLSVAAVLVIFGPPGSDLAAHEYQRWFFLEHGFSIWDNSWYSGRYVFVTYSWLTYPLAALLGVEFLLVLSLGLGAAMFAALVRYRPAAWAFAVVWGCFALSAAVPFALGVAFGLAGLVTACSRAGEALRPSGGRLAAFAVLAALTWASSPLALLLLVVVLLGLRLWTPLAIALPFVALQIVLTVLYPNAGHFPFSWQEAAAAAVFCVGAIAFARPPLRGVFVIWLALVVASFAFPSLLGENAARLRFMALPLALLALRGRPLLVAAPLAVVAAVYNLSPLAWSFEKGLDERAENAAYWAPAVAFLKAHADANFRVNALDTVGHWEAYHLPRSGIPITRGWFRQDDFPHNELLYEGSLEPQEYERWLREQGVRYVLVPRDRLDYSSKHEPAAVRAVARRVAQAGEVAIYELQNPTPIVPGARVTRLAHDSLTVATPRPGRYTVRVREGAGWRVFSAPRAGTFTLTFP